MLAREGAEAVRPAAFDLGDDPFALEAVTPFENDVLRQARRRTNRGERDHTGGELFLSDSSARSAPGVSPSIVCVMRASVTASPAAGTCARSSQNKIGTPSMPTIHTSWLRSRGSDRNDIGSVSSSQAVAPINEIGSACSSGIDVAIGKTTSAAIQLQNA